MIRMKPPLPAQGRPDEEKDRSAIRGSVLFPFMLPSCASAPGFDGGDAGVAALGEVELPDAHAHVKDV